MKQLYEINVNIQWVSKNLTNLCEGLEDDKYKSAKDIISLSSTIKNTISQIRQDIKDYSSQFKYSFSDLKRRFTMVKESLVEILDVLGKSNTISKNKEQLVFCAAGGLGVWEEKCLDEYGSWVQSFLEYKLESAIDTKNLQLGKEIIDCAKEIDFCSEDLLEKQGELVKKCPPILLLKQYQQELKTNKLLSLIGEKLSPSISYLTQTPAGYQEKSVKLVHSETYVRSEKHPKVLKLGKNALILYSDKELQNGDPAHAGSYGNLMQMLGDTFEASDQEMTTSPGNALLYHSLLFYKNRTCEYIVDEMMLNKHTSMLKVGFYNKYPCVMVWIDPKSICKSEQTTWPSPAAQDEWVNFLMSYFVGLVNFNAYKADIPIELQRRSSFGFMTPTIAPTSGSFRINIGVVPKVYADIIVASLKQLNEVLKSLSTLALPLPEDIFYGSAAHKKYLTEVTPKKVNPKKTQDKKVKVKKIYEPIILDSLLHVLWAQIEKRGKTTVQNVVRTAYARDGIAMEVLNKLMKNKTHVQAFASGLEWAINKIYIKKLGARTSISLKTEEELNSNIKFTNHKCKINDESFWKMIADIIRHFSKLEIPRLHSTLEKLRQCCKSKMLNEVYLHLDMLNQLIFVSSIDNAKIEENGDGYGSDSDTEEVVTVKTRREQSANAKHKIEKKKIVKEEIKDELEKIKIFSKKIITHNGMRAIWGVILTISQYLKEKNDKGNTTCRLCLDNTYYEVPLGLKIISQLHKDSSIQQVKTKDLANSILYDLNACVTNGKPSELLDLETIGNKILILDATSATNEQINPYLLNFAQSRSSMLFVVDSGFKNQQGGADLNQYGTVRIFTRDKKTLEKLYSKIKTIEPPLLSPTSHALRRIYKAADLVPVTRKLFKN